MRRVVNTSFFLASRTLKNRLLFSIRRLKRPRYLISALISIAYFWMLFGRNRSFKGFKGVGQGPLGEIVPESLTMVITVVIFFVMLLPWAWPGSKAGLQFTEPEIQFLFPAPFSRAHLMFYKWIRNLVGLSITAFVFRFFSGASSFIGMLFVMIAFDAYFTLVRCSRARLRLAGFPWLARAGIVAAVAAGAGWMVWSHFLTELGSREPSAKVVIHAFKSGFLDFPAVIFFGIPFIFAAATTTADVVVRSGFMALTLAIAGISFLIATRIDTDFEESSIEVSRKKAEMQAQMHGKGAPRVVARKMPAPFRLHPHGNPAVAIFWKNLIAGGRVYAAHIGIIVAMFVPLIIFGLFRKSDPELLGVLGIIVLIVGGFLSLAGAAMFRNDLRGDLERVDLLRSFPISGPSLLTAEVAAPAVIISVAQTLLVSLGGLLLLNSGRDFSWNTFGALMTIVLLIGVPLNAVQVTIQNAWALLLPGWSFVGKEENRGFASTGQGILMMLGQMLLLAVALLIPALAFVASLWMFAMAIDGKMAVLSLSLILPCGILLAELYGAMNWLGHHFEDLDLANDDLAPR